MNEPKAFLTWQDLGGIFGAWGFLFGVLTALDVPVPVALATIIVPILAAVLLLQYRIAKRKQYWFVRRGPGEDAGDELLQYIAQATDYILLCHFRDEVPSTQYLRCMLQAHQRGVTVHRLVGWPRCDLAERPSTRWIEDQIEEGLAEHRFLEEKVDPFLWEIFVYDGDVGVIALPPLDPVSTGKLPLALASTDRRFVKILEMLFRAQWERAYNA